MAFAEVAIVSPGSRTGTVSVHRGSLLPSGQLLPGRFEVTVKVRSRLPVSGLLTRALTVTVIVAPTGMSPVQAATAPSTTRVPELAVCSPVGVASSPMSAPLIGTVMPV